MSGLFGGGGGKSTPVVQSVAPKPAVKPAPVVTAVEDELATEKKKVRKGVGTSAPVSLLAAANPEDQTLG